MRSRRFLLLAAFLVALNIALWLVPQGSRCSRSIVATLFGKNMVRAAGHSRTSGMHVARRPRHRRHQRGRERSRCSEADGASQPIAVSARSTKVTAGGCHVKLKAIKPGWRVLVTWPAPSGPADSVMVEKQRP